MAATVTGQTQVNTHADPSNEQNVQVDVIHTQIGGKQVAVYYAAGRFQVADMVRPQLLFDAEGQLQHAINADGWQELAKYADMQDLQARTLEILKGPEQSRLKKFAHGAGSKAYGFGAQIADKARSHKKETMIGIASIIFAIASYYISLRYNPFGLLPTKAPITEVPPVTSQPSTKAPGAWDWMENQ